MTDIARVAKVSRPTVSIVLNGRHNTARISDETRDRVLQVARELGYRRNALAHAVKTGRSFSLGYLTTASDSEYSLLILSGILNEAEARGYTVKRFPLSNTEKDIDVIGRCSEERPDGVIVNDYGQGACLDALCQEFKIQNIPHVWLNSHGHIDGPHIYHHDEEGIASAVRHLVELGHTKIAFVGGRENRGTSVPRVAGFRRAMREANLNDLLIYWTNWDGALAEQYFEEAISQRTATGFITGSDALALHLILKINRMGFRVPEVASVIGCGDMSRSIYSYPPLTTVSVPYHELGRASVDHLLRLIQEPETTTLPQETPIATPLAVRESTGAPPKA